MPRSKSSPSLRRLCLVSVAKNIDYWCDDFVQNFNDQKLLYVIGPFDCLPQSLIHDLSTIMKEMKIIRRSHLMLLIHPETDKLDLSRSSYNEIPVPFALNLVGRICKNLKHLNLSFCDKISPHVLIETAASLPHIVSLNLRSSGCTDAVLAALGGHCPQLRSLDVSWCPVTDDGISSLCINMDDIENAENSRCLKINSLLVIGTNITDRGAMIAIKHLPYLRVFEYPNNCRSLELLYGDADSDWSAVHPLETLYYDCEPHSFVAQQTIEMAVITCPNVNKVCLTNSNMSDQILLLLSNFSHLSDLSLGNGPLSSLSFNGVSTLLRLKGNHLTTLVLVEIPQVDVNVIGQCCPCLQHIELLFIAGYESPESDVCTVRTPFEQLRIIRIVCTEEYDIPGKQLLTLLAHCPNLHDVFLQRCQTLTDSLLNDALNSNTLPNLTLVELEYCNTLTVASVMSLFSLDNPLNSLKMWWCRGITRADYSFLKDLVMQENLDTTVEWR
uniref:F-box domain-containing protein n=1 Tax=Strigamia maritima TaxID=126957 RepID=T1IP17_STRMM